MMKKKVLLVCSGGGHWVQMTRLLPAVQSCELEIMTVQPQALTGFHISRFHKIGDFNRKSPIKCLLGLTRIARVIFSSSPDVVISTGAAPGLLAIAVAKTLGKRTLWIDSIANPKKLSLSGRLVRPFADEILTQWPELDGRGGAKYCGRVI